MAKDTSKQNKSNQRKRNDIIQFVSIVAAIVLLNYLATMTFTRLDLTEDKRYSLTDATTEKLQELEDIVFIKVYLEGDLPAGYERLRDATQEMLDEFRAYAGDNIQYEFIDPSANPNEEKRKQFYQKLSDKGLEYTNVRVNEGDKRSEQIIFPGAIVTYRDQEEAVQLLQSQMQTKPEVMLNNSIQQLEYELMSKVKVMTQYAKKRVGFVRGHGELDDLETADIQKSLSDFYIVDSVRINGQLDALQLHDAIVIAGPKEKISEKDKYVIDQFIMKGGKVMWFVEPVTASMDSIRKKGITLGVPQDVNLSDQLFKYGARINSDFLLDLQAVPIPVVTGMVGNQPKQEFFPWYYYPLLFPQSQHPIVHNLDAIKTQFASSIDLVGDTAIKKTPLLRTSKYTKVASAPHRVALNILRHEPDQRQYNNSHQIVAALLEGEFESVFKNRLTRKITENPEFRFKEKSLPTKMLVVSDADIIRNNVNRSEEKFFTLGYDKYTRKIYGNKEFVLNAMNYLLEDDNLITARSKDFKMRLLDKPRVERERRFWQILNTAAPVILILIFGVIQFYIRKKLYT
ncbi:gliding motility-associated ABC transporter substrate-binding protein GldG [Salibacter halophilus]|uniref:Gliding motility-associated ABC transporter substrate-binding protein GldG n=2 Tax=Pseudomonadati TaxID=3379134 RepID=A0A6N6M9L3_9FLAO|nr:gliding motility-associated ABC transporter substrate-binding protein GldG [Salibacter halophilus]KAB1064846.1 gliding motility-associated ABC transporter substrate-binding protein GldG [Salibacter halophilus]